MKVRHFLPVMLSCGVLLLQTACIDNRYDLSKIDMRMSVGGDSLCLPLASLDTIFMRQIFNPDSSDIFKCDDNGYRIQMSDSLSIDIPEIGNIDFNDLNFSPKARSIEFIDASSAEVSIPGFHQSIKTSVGQGNRSMDVDLPNVSKSANTSIGIAQYMLSDAEKIIQVAPISITKSNFLGNAYLPGELSALISSLPHTLIPLLLETPSVNLNETQDFDISLNVPEALSSIDWIALAKDPDAVMSFSLTLENASSLLESGEVIPDIRIFPASFFSFASSSDVDSEGNIVFGSSDIMNKANGYTISKQVAIDSLLVYGAAENGQLNLHSQSQVTGSAYLDNVTYYADNFNAIKNLSFKVNISINNAVIQSMYFEIPTQEAQIPSGEVEFKVDNRLPDHVAGVDSMTVSEPGTVSVNIAANPSLSGLQGNIFIDELDIQFPSEFVFAATEGLNPATNRYHVSNLPYNPFTGNLILFQLKKIDMSAMPVTDGKISYNGKVSYSGQASVKGKINSGLLPEESLDLSIDVESDIEAMTFYVRTEDISEHVNFSKPFNISVMTNEKIARIDEADVQDGTYLDISIDVPDEGIDITGDLAISLPKMISFEADSHLNSDNQYLINGEIPNNIKLKIKKLVINQDLEDGTLKIADSVVVSGMVMAPAGHYSSSTLLNLLNDEINVSVDLPELKLTNIDLGLTGIMAEVTDSVSIRQKISLPDAVRSLDSVLLSEDASVKVEVTVSGLPALTDASGQPMPIKLSCRIATPDILMLDAAGVNSQGVINLEADIVNDTPITRTLKLKGLNCQDIEIADGQLSIDEYIHYSVNVLLEDAKLQSSSFTGQPVSIATKITLQNASIADVYGNVSIETEMDEEISLGDMPEMLTGDNVLLDIYPAIELVTRTNVGVPISLEGSIEPVYEKAGETAEAQKFSLNVLCDHVVDGVYENRFWIATDRTGMPDDCQFAEVNFNQLFKKLPDNLGIKMKAQTEEGVQHHINLSDELFMNVDYDLILPLRFGEDFHIALDDTLALGSSLGEYTDVIGEAVELVGTISNSIPLNLAATLVPVDEDNQVLSGFEPISLNIRSGKADGSATEQKVCISLANKNNQLEELGGFIMHISLDSDQAAVTGIQPENFLTGKFGLRVLGGFTFDAKELLNGEESNE